MYVFDVSVDEEEQIKLRNLPASGSRRYEKWKLWHYERQFNDHAPPTTGNRQVC